MERDIYNIYIQLFIYLVVSLRNYNTIIYTNKLLENNL